MIKMIKKAQSKHYDTDHEILIGTRKIYANEKKTLEPAARPYKEILVYFGCLKRF